MDFIYKQALLESFLFHEYMKVELLNKNYWDIYCREIFINMKFHRIPTNKQTGQIFLLSSLT